MELTHLVDGPSAAIVIGGTLIATVLRCGVRASGITVRLLLYSIRRTFDAGHARAELTVQVQQIHRDGLLRTEPRHFGDREFDEMTDALIERRSVEALLSKHEANKHIRLKRSETAVATLNQAAEMGPVFGLAGTLIALSQLPDSASTGKMLSSNIPGAIITTFYGLMLANLIFAPLARFIQRRSDEEDAKRQELIDWLAIELAREGIRPSLANERIAA